MEHTEKMRALSNRFTPAVEALVQQFGELVEEAKVRLGGLFRPGDYPPPDELRSKFSFETKVMPLPDAGEFRVALGDEEKEHIKRQITAAVEASLQVASRELWQRLYEAVSHLAERLQAYKVTEEGVEHPFRDSVVTNLVKLVDVLPKLNVTADPELERLAAELQVNCRFLGVLPPATIRQMLPKARLFCLPSVTTAAGDHLLLWLRRLRGRGARPRREELSAQAVPSRHLAPDRARCARRSVTPTAGVCGSGTICWRDCIRRDLTLSCHFFASHDDEVYFSRGRGGCEFPWTSTFVYPLVLDQQ